MGKIVDYRASDLHDRQQVKIKERKKKQHFQKQESLAYIFVAACIGLSSLKFVQLAPKDASFLHQRAPECVLAVEDHPRSMILVPIESTYATSY